MRLATSRLVSNARDFDLIKCHLVDWTVHDLAAELGVCRRLLERAFKRHLGMSTYQYLITERLHAARQLLEGNEPVLETFARCGFTDASSFAQMYTRHFGELPSETKRRSR